MKLSLIIVLIIILLIVGAWGLYAWLLHFSAELAAGTAEIYSELSRDSALSLTDITELRDSWQSKEKLLRCLLDHDDITAISLRMLRTEEWLKQDKSAEAAIELRELQHLLYYLPKTQGLGLEGIL